MDARYRRAVLTLLLLLVALPGHSQIWTDYNDHDPGIVSVEAMIPSFTNSFVASSPSSAYEIYSRFPINNSISLIASVPLSYYKISQSFFDVDVELNEIAIGNPYIGARLGKRLGVLKFEGGIRLPVSSSDDIGLLTGQIIENHALSRFLPATTTIAGTLKYYKQKKSGIVFRAGGGPEVWFPKEEDTELIFNYYGQILYRTNAIAVGAGLSGLAIITESELSFGDRTLNDIGIVGYYNFSSGFRAGGYLRVPVDDEVNEILDLLFGVQLGVVL